MTITVTHDSIGNVYKTHLGLDIMGKRLFALKLKLYAAFAKGNLTKAVRQSKSIIKLEALINASGKNLSVTTLLANQFYKTN
jgi:hypothetical protein